MNVMNALQKFSLLIFRVVYAPIKTFKRLQKKIGEILSSPGGCWRLFLLALAAFACAISCIILFVYIGRPDITDRRFNYQVQL